MKHPKRYCVDCRKDQFLTIRGGRDYDMYHCRSCGASVCRVGDGEPTHSRLTVLGGIAVRDLSAEVSEGADLTAMALGNPNVLSDEHAMWEPRDEEAEEEREDMLRTFRVALTNLTPRQAQILDAVDIYGTQERAAVALGITQQAVDKTISGIQKKLGKHGCYPSKEGLKGKDAV